MTHRRAFRSGKSVWTLSSWLPLQEEEEEEEERPPLGVVPGCSPPKLDPNENSANSRRPGS